MSTPEMAPLAAFVQLWKAAFAKILAQLGAADITTPDADTAGLPLAAPDDATRLAVRFQGGGTLKGQLQASVEKTVAVQLAQLLMSEPLDAAAEFSALHLDGFLEFFRQVAGEVALAWKNMQGAPSDLAHQAEAAGALASQSAAAFTIETDKCKGLAVRLDVDAEFLEAISAAPPAEEEAEPAAKPAARNLPTNLDLILDVQLEATIRFGEREMLLKDVFALMPGAVVELDQLVNEPAELLVAGRLVATGEVVVVDGNFGLRVKEVLSPAQRMMALSLG